MKEKKKIFICMLLTLVMLAIMPVGNVMAASKYITVSEYLELIVKELKLDVNKASENPYVEAAYLAGIVKDGEFTDYSSFLTRTDAAVLINRADEYLYGTDTLDEMLFNYVYKERISDLNKVAKSKRGDVAKAVAKGYLAGYSNGYYVKNRALKGSQKITYSGAKNLVSMLNNLDKRSKLSPDGMLIRTTKLPKNAKRFDYILVSYPNDFYDTKFNFEYARNFTGDETDLISYAWPVDVVKTNGTVKRYIDYKYEWAKLVENYLQDLFNVDYRTVDDEWALNLVTNFTTNFTDKVIEITDWDTKESYKIDAGTYYKNMVLDYIKKIKENNVIVEVSDIIVEPSTFSYNLSTGYTMRCYVKYKVTLKDPSVEIRNILFVGDGYSYVEGIKSGKWRTGIFDVSFFSLKSLKEANWFISPNQSFFW